MVQVGAKMRGLCSVDLRVSTQRFQNEQIKKEVKTKRWRIFDSVFRSN